MDIKKYLLAAMEEMTEYMNSEDYSELEQHDCRVAYETYETVLGWVCHEHERNNEE